jgi:FtsH ternary system domain X3-analog
MAEITIRLRRDPETGKHDILIDMESDQDALPHEHEQMHREAVEKLIGKHNVGKVIIEREEEKTPSSPESTQAPQREAHKQGSV